MSSGGVRSSASGAGASSGASLITSQATIAGTPDSAAAWARTCVPELVDLQVALALGRGEHPADRAGDGADAGPAGRELTPGAQQALDQRLAALRILFGFLDQRLDRAAGHPAAAVLPVAAQLVDALVEDCRHGRHSRRIQGK